MPARNFAPVQLSIPETVRGALNRLTDEKALPRLAIKAQEGDDGVPELHIFDVIGYGDYWSEEKSGSTQEGVAEFLAANRGKDIRVLINSPGGLVYEGLAIYNQLISHDAKVTTRNIAMAGSMASGILMAGDEVEMFDNATLFIHRALAVAIGNNEEMRDMADFLEQIDGQLAGIYAARTGKTKAQILKIMRGEGKKDGTYLTAAQAKADGFVTAVISSKKQGDKDGKKAKAEGDDKPGEQATEFTPEETAAAVQHEAVRNRLRMLALDEHAALSYLESVG